ncbi:MAG: SusC/RagA family TonB-linked outer membrane protein [Prevotellaceae bacterium]|jgi:TonB-linked SusC/RagA family outer membrane protein|nr:SusC/RagA family TonB-linked outer membrane protein [Prevotellaceae bacterium]
MYYTKRIFVFVIMFFLCFPYLLESKTNESILQQIQEKKVTLSIKNRSIRDILTEIEKQTGIGFALNDSKIESDLKELSISVTEITVAQALNTLLENTRYTYQVVEGHIVITLKPVAQRPVAGATIKAITGKIAGVVLNEDREPLPGASIQLKGTTQGILSDAGGEFEYSFLLPLPQTLVFSFVGYENKEIVVSESLQDIEVILNFEEAELKDVVVTGYSNIRKSSFTGTSVTVTKDDLLKISSGNVLQTLQVFDPSLRTVRNLEMGSNPNNLPEFNMRGAAGIGITELDRLEGADVSQFALKNNPNLPVFILDGYEVSTEKLFDMDVNRIESITILKDAAATAMYGSRAANGVIVIESVAPKAGKLQVTYNMTGTATAPDLSSYNLMNAREKLDAEVAAGLLDEGSGFYTRLDDYRKKMNNIERGVDTYWLSQPLQTKINHRHSLFVEGGAETVRFGLGVNYDAEKGIMKDSYRNRAGADLRVNYRIKSIQITDNVSYTRMNSQQSPYGDFFTYVRMPPYVPIYDIDTNEIELNYSIGTSGNVYTNPLYDVQKRNFNRTGYDQFTNNLSVNAYFLKYFQLKFQFAVNYTDNLGEQFIDPNASKFRNGLGYTTFTRGELFLRESKSFAWNTNLMLMYNRSIKDHNINFNLALNANENSDNSASFVYCGFPPGQFSDARYSSGLRDTPVFGDEKSRLAGAFLMTNYTYRNIYLFDLSVRADGSSRFGSKERYAPFWSFGAGINLHNYEFMKANTVVTNARVKANYGQTGRVSFSPYAARNTYQLMMDDWYTTGIGGSLMAMGNDLLTWDKVNTLNIGVDFTLWNRATFNLSWYDKRTRDMVTSISIPSSAGFTSYVDNMGEVSNKGYEIFMNLAIVKQTDWGVNLIANGAHNKNKIVKISEALKAYNDRVDKFYENYSETPIYNNIVYNERNDQYTKPIRKYEEGGSEYAIFGMKSLGIDPATGAELFMNRDGTVTYDWNAAEQQIVGNTEPLLQGSFSLNARYKNFSLYTTFIYEFGGDLYNTTLINNVESVDLSRYNADRRATEQRWKQPGDVVQFKSVKDRYGFTRPTSRFVQKNNTLMFNSLSLAYDFDRNLVKRLGLRMLRFQVTMNEIGVLSTIHQERGTSYPFARKFGFTLNAGF